MAKKAEEIKTFLSKIIENNGCEIVDVEIKKIYGENNITIFIDKDGGVDLNTCELIHNAISDPMDELDPTNGQNYILNVSSPGLDRPFKTQKDYLKHLNDDIEISLFKPIEKLKKFEAKLISYNNDNIDVEYKGKILKINIKDIAKANLAIKF